MRKRKKTIRNLFFALLVLGVFLTGAEWASRYYLQNKSDVKSQLQRDERVEYEPILGWRWQNDHYFRDRPSPPQEKPTDLKRIIAMGDSCTYGAGVEAAETYTMQLETILNENNGDNRFEALNAGVHGYNSRQVYLYLREYMLSFQPDLVIVYCNPYDVAYNPADETTARPSSANPLNSLLFRSKFVYLFRYFFYHKREKPRDSNDAITEITYLAKIRELLDEHNASMLIVQYLSKENNQINWDERNKRRKWEAPLVDILTRMQASGFPPDQLYLDFVHPTALGHRLIAETIYQTMQQERILIQ